MLMEVFDAVRPELKLSQDFKFYTIPLDTLKAVSSKQGFVKSVNYRPSRQRKINYKIKQMSKEQYKSFLRAVRDEDYDLSKLLEKQRADVLETAYEYIQYQYIKGDLELEQYRKKSFRALKARNQAPYGQVFNELKAGKDPIDTHDSALASLSMGLYDKHLFEQLRLRFAYHGLTDRQHGFLKGAEINFMDLKFRHYEKDDRYVLQNMQILSLASLSPISDVFSAPSYKISLDIERQDDPKNNNSGYTFNGSVAGGGSFEVKNAMFYALSSLEGAYGGFLKNDQWIGMGLNAGVLINTDKASIQTEAKRIFATDKIGSKFIIKAQFDYYLSKNLALEASYKKTINYGRDFDEYLLGFNRYF